jgi:hypothetical protein
MARCGSANSGIASNAEEGQAQAVPSEKRGVQGPVAVHLPCTGQRRLRHGRQSSKRAVKRCCAAHAGARWPPCATQPGRCMPICVQPIGRLFPRTSLGLPPNAGCGQPRLRAPIRHRNVACVTTWTVPIDRTSRRAAARSAVIAHTPTAARASTLLLAGMTRRCAPAARGTR